MVCLKIEVPVTVRLEHKCHCFRLPARVVMQRGGGWGWKRAGGRRKYEREGGDWRWEEKERARKRMGDTYRSAAYVALFHNYANIFN